MTLLQRHHPGVRQGSLSFSADSSIGHPGEQGFGTLAHRRSKELRDPDMLVAMASVIVLNGESRAQCTEQSALSSALALKFHRWLLGLASVECVELHRT